MTVGERIAMLLERRGWSQGQLADRTGLTTAYISRLIRNHYRSPGYVALKKIADALAVSVTDLDSSALAAPGPVAGEISRTDELDLPVYRTHAGRLERALADGSAS